MAIDQNLYKSQDTKSKATKRTSEAINLSDGGDDKDKSESDLNDSNMNSNNRSFLATLRKQKIRED